MQLNITLPPSNLTRLNRTHLIDPTLRRLKLANGTDLIRRIARDTDIVVALEDELDVADLEGLGAAGFGALAGCCDDLVDELVGDGEDGLICVSGLSHKMVVRLRGGGGCQGQVTSW